MPMELCVLCGRAFEMSLGVRSCTDMFFDMLWSYGPFNYGCLAQRRPILAGFICDIMTGVLL